MKQMSGNEDTVGRAVPPAGENGHNGEEHLPPEMKAARELARRYRLPFVDLLPHDRESPIDYNLFTEVPVDLMVRHQFVPLKRDQKGLHIAMADPTDLERLDELSGTLRTRVAGSSFGFSHLACSRNRARRGGPRSRSTGDRLRHVADHQTRRHDHLQC